MAEKYLRVTMPDESQWDVPARFIAEHRAKYYADLDVKCGDADNFEKAFAHEVEWVMQEKSGYEIQDWAANNMNWEDVASYATLAVPAPSEVDFQEGWCNGEKEVVER